MVVDRKELVKRVSNKFVPKNKPLVKQVVDAFFDKIVYTLEQGENIQLVGLGKFIVLKKKARLGRNPKTKKTVMIPARKTIVFHFSNKLRQNNKLKRQ